MQHSLNSAATTNYSKYYLNDNRYTNLTGKSKQKFTPPERPRHRRDNNVKGDIKNISYKDVNYRPLVQASVNLRERGEHFVWLSDCWLPRKHYTSCS